MKQNQWKVEDIQQGNLEKLEKEKKKETKLFLNQIRKRPRFAQIFVDQYSLRDENINKNIIEIRKYLGRNLYKKKNLNNKIEKYLQELEKNNLIMEENSIQEENSLNKEQNLLHEMMLHNMALEDEEDKEYHRMGVNQKQEIMSLVKEGRKEKTKEEIMQEDLYMFQTFKQDVIKKDTMYKSLGLTQFKNQILNYSEYSVPHVNSAANTGIVNVNRDFYENYRIDPSKISNGVIGNNKNLKNIESGDINDQKDGERYNLIRVESSNVHGVFKHNNNKFNSPKFTNEDSNAANDATFNLNLKGSDQGISLPPINPRSGKNAASSAENSERNGNINGYAEIATQDSKGENFKIFKLSFCI